MEPKIKYKQSNNKVTIYVSGDIDSSNANKVENDLLAIVNDIAKDNLVEVVMDFENLSYIASAGLRVLLGLKKAHSNMRIIKVQNPVYDILEMTGFTSLLNITKMYKTISIKGLELLGEGYVGKVYRLDDERIIKVFYRINSKEDIYRERNLSKEAFLLGIPTAISYEIVKVEEGGYGAIFEMVKSDCLNKVMAKDLEHYDKYERMYSNLLKTILGTNVPDGKLPDKKDTAKEWFKGLRKFKAFDEKVTSKIEQMTLSLPDTHTMVHGDCHVKNLMIQNDELLLIDMETLGHGHPIFEISAFYLTYLGYPAIDHDNAKEFLGLDYEVCEKLYNDLLSDLFEGHSKEQIAKYQEQIELLAYAWLSYKTYLFEPNNTKRIDDCKKRVLSLIDKVNTLDFAVNTIQK